MFLRVSVDLSTFISMNGRKIAKTPTNTVKIVLFGYHLLVINKSFGHGGLYIRIIFYVLNLQQDDL